MHLTGKLSLFLILWRLQVLAFGSAIAPQIQYPVISPNGPYAHPGLPSLTTLTAHVNANIAADTPHVHNRPNIRNMQDINVASPPLSRKKKDILQEATNALDASTNSTAPHDVTTQRQKAKLHMKMSEATALGRDLDGLAKVADSLSEALHAQKEPPSPANTQLQETLNTNEALAKEEAAEQAVNEETAKEMEVEKEQLAEMENQVEGEENAEEAEDNAKLERRADQEDAKDMIEDAKENAEEAAEKETKAGLEQQEKSAIERSILEEADINKNLAEDVETEALMKESSEKTASNRDKESVVEALHNDARRMENAQKELQRRKQLLTDDETQAQQSKLVNQLEERLGTAVQHCMNVNEAPSSSPLLGLNDTTNSETLTVHSATSFLKKHDTLALSPKSEADRRHTSVHLSVLGSADVSSNPSLLLRSVRKRNFFLEKASTNKPKVLNSSMPLTFNQTLHGHPDTLFRANKSHPESHKNESNGKSLSLSQWLYFTVFFPAGIGASALLLVFFV